MMSSCGMYDYSGEWVYRVGHPGQERRVRRHPRHPARADRRSRVYSPPLDAAGQQRARRPRLRADLATTSSLHVLRVHSTAGAVVRRTYRGVAARSNRVRPEPEVRVLDRHERDVVVHELQGDLYFASMEVDLPARSSTTSTTPASWCSTSDVCSASTMPRRARCSTSSGAASPPRTGRSCSRTARRRGRAVARLASRSPTSTRRWNGARPSCSQTSRREVVTADLADQPLLAGIDPR